MAHDPTQVLLGTTQTSSKQGTEDFAQLPTTFLAGLAVRRTSADELSLTTGSLIGISLGESLSGRTLTTVLKAGERVPLRLTDGFTPTIGAQVHISDTTGMGIAAGGGATGVNALYVSGVMGGVVSGVTETVRVALIDMPGGL